MARERSLDADVRCLCIQVVVVLVAVMFPLGGAVSGALACCVARTVFNTALVLSTFLCPSQYFTRKPKFSHAGDFSDRGGSTSSGLPLAVAMTTRAARVVAGGI